LADIGLFQDFFAMPRKTLNIPDAELAVMQCLWEHGSASARELTDWLYPGGGTAQVATVQKLLTRLEEKKCVQRNRGNWPHLFQAAVQREDVISSELQGAADRLCEGAMHPLLTHLVKAANLSATDRHSLRALLDELDQSPGPGKK
jgi:predicted transcriptional regulator